MKLTRRWAQGVLAFFLLALPLGIYAQDEDVHSSDYVKTVVANGSEGHSLPHFDQDPMTAYVFWGLAAFFLVAIIWSSIKVESLSKKVWIYLTLGGLASAIVTAYGGSAGWEMVRLIYLKEYLQFIPIPWATVLLAAAGLFQLKELPKSVRLGWFVAVVFAILGNFGTTWIIVPMGLAIVETLRLQFPPEQYGMRWKEVLILISAFSMNILAVLTLLADPPQALWAVMEKSHGIELSFFEPGLYFFPYFLITLVFYIWRLRAAGVEFMGVKGIRRMMRPENGEGTLRAFLNNNPFKFQSLAKVALGVLIVWLIAHTVTVLEGYEITSFLGTVCLILFGYGYFSGNHHIKEETKHWTAELLAVFVAFFSVALLFLMGLQHMSLGEVPMAGLTVLLTWFADNAIAFFAGYFHFSEAGVLFVVYIGLFLSIVFGGTSPFGNGTQITLFLVILSNRYEEVTVASVIKSWVKTTWYIIPYLLVWAIGFIMLLLHWEVRDTQTMLAAQLPIGLIAFVVGGLFAKIHDRFFHNY
jgi:hypothetical protein